MSDVKEQEEETNVEQVSGALIIFGWIHVILFAIYCAIVLWDTQFSTLNFAGLNVFYAYTLIWWMLCFVASFNLLLIGFFFTMVAKTTSPNYHIMFTYISFIVNLLYLAICVVYYFFFINKAYTGDQPFNDGKWCCYYFLDNPNYCYNNAPCSVLPNLTTPDIFIWHWAFSGVFVVMSVLHIGANEIARIVKIVRKESRYTGIIVAWIYIIVYAYWAAFPLWDTQFKVLYSYQWWFVMFLIFNIFPPTLYLLYSNFKKSLLLENIFFWIGGIITSFVTFVSLAVFIGVWIFDCNWSSDGDSICDSYQYCCQYLTAWCPNNMPCPYPTNLQLTSEYAQMMIFSFVFIILTTVLIWTHYRVKRQEQKV